MKKTTLPEALKAILGLPPKERAQAIADVHLRQKLEAHKIVSALPPEDLKALSDKLPKSVKDMTQAEYRASKAAAISQSISGRRKAEDADALKKITDRHSIKVIGK